MQVCKHETQLRHCTIAKHFRGREKCFFGSLCNYDFFSMYCIGKNKGILYICVLLLFIFSHQSILNACDILLGV